MYLDRILCHGIGFTPRVAGFWSGRMVRPAMAILLLGSLAGSSVGSVPVPAAERVLCQQQEPANPDLPGSSQAGKPRETSAATPRLVLEDGTPVHLKFARAVVSSEVIAGEKIDLQVTEEVRAGDRLAIRKDSLAQAMVTMAQAKRGMGRGGNLEMKIQAARLASGETAPLRMVKDVKGEGRKGAMVGGMVATGLVFLPAAPLFLFVPGKNAVIPKGTEITAYVNGDVSLDAAKLPAATVPQAAPKEAVPQD
jgi:hypothetical protein